MLVRRREAMIRKENSLGLKHPVARKSQASFFFPTRQTGWVRCPALRHPPSKTQARRDSISLLWFHNCPRRRKGCKWLLKVLPGSDTCHFCSYSLAKANHAATSRICGDLQYYPLPRGKNRNIWWARWWPPKFLLPHFESQEFIQNLFLQNVTHNLTSMYISVSFFSCPHTLVHPC